VLDSEDPYIINLHYSSPQKTSRGESSQPQSAYHFRIAIPAKYPFVPPTWKWVSRPCQKPHPCLGPDGVVSVEALSQWTPANSLSNVLISLFPSCILADQCSSVTSHLWNLKVRPGIAK
jgi:ubiquitin-protein ligase